MLADDLWAMIEELKIKREREKLQVALRVAELFDAGEALKVANAKAILELRESNEYAKHNQPNCYRHAQVLFSKSFFI